MALFFCLLYPEIEHNKTFIETQCTIIYIDHTYLPFITIVEFLDVNNKLQTADVGKLFDGPSSVINATAKCFYNSADEKQVLWKLNHKIIAWVYTEIFASVLIFSTVILCGLLIYDYCNFGQCLKCLLLPFSFVKRKLFHRSEIDPSINGDQDNSQEAFVSFQVNEGIPPPKYEFDPQYVTIEREPPAYVLK